MTRPVAVVSVDVDSVDAHLVGYGVTGIPHDPLVQERALPRLLDVFARTGIRATLFVVGREAERHSAVLQAAVAAGHEIASHTWSHPLRFASLPRERQRTELEDSRRGLESACGAPVVGFRAPNFDLDARAVPLLVETGYRYDASAYPSLMLVPARLLLALKSADRGGVLTMSWLPFTWRRAPYTWTVRGASLREFPLAVTPVLRMPVYHTLRYWTSEPEWAARLDGFARRGELAVVRTARRGCTGTGGGPRRPPAGTPPRHAASARGETAAARGHASHHRFAFRVTHLPRSARLSPRRGNARRLREYVAGQHAPNPFARSPAMKAIRLLLLSLSLTASAGVAAAAGPSLTVYSSDLGYVREMRAFDLAGNHDVVRLEDVSQRLDFSSVRLVPRSGRLTRLAYRYDLATGDGVFEKSLGRRVRVEQRGNRVVEGTLLAANGEWLVVQGDDGALTNARREAIDQVRFADQVSGLSLKPAIEAVIDGATKGRSSAEFSYLTGGLSWSAEHMLVRTGETTAQWSTVVNLANTSGRDYVDASLKLVAGQPNRVGQQRFEMAASPMAMKTTAGAPGMDVSEQAFADYHLYTVGRTLTLRDRETQSFMLVDPTAISVKPRYLFQGVDPRGVKSQLELVNSAKAGPGVPLPAGRVRSFQLDPDDEAQFTGETNISHTPVDEKRTLDLGIAFDLQAERRPMSSRRISDREREYSVEIELRNRKPLAATIVVEEPAGGDVEIIKSSQPWTRKDEGTLTTTVEVPAGKTVIVSYTARQRW